MLNKAEVQNKVLVAGGAGFVGSHLCDRLIADGYGVVCLDNLYTGSMGNIRHLTADGRFSFVEHDVNEPFRMQDVSLVFNLACPASPVHYQKDAVFTTRTAVIGTLNLLELARENGCPLIQASTSEVYGDPLVHPQPESYWGNVNPVGVRSCYDEGKRCAESLCMDYHRQYGVPVKIVRIFNTYGPRMSVDDGRVVSNFIVQALKGEDITVYGDGSQTRSFMYVDDLIEGFMRVMNTGDDFTGPVNIGNPEEYTVNDLAGNIIRMTGSKSCMIHLSLPKDDPCRRRPDIRMTKQSTGWEPKVTIESGLTQTIDYFKSINNVNHD